MLDLFIRDDEGRAHYRVNAREENGRIVIEPRGTSVRDIMARAEWAEGKRLARHHDDRIRAMGHDRMIAAIERRVVEIGIVPTTREVDDDGLKYLEHGHVPGSSVSIVPLPYEVGDDHLQALEDGELLVELEVEVGDA